MTQMQIRAILCRRRRFANQDTGKPWASVAALLLIISVFSAVYPTSAATLVPHEAHYRLSLVQLKIPGEAASAGGDLALRVEKTCGHWRIISRFDFNIVFRDAQRRMRLEVAHGLEEDLEGQTLLFESHNAVNGVKVLSVKGTANMPEGGGVGRAVFMSPQRADYALPAGTLFPTATTHRTVDALERGARIDSYFLFDGSNPAGPYRVSDVAGGRPLALERPPTGDHGLLSTPSWRVTSAFFDHRSVDAEPLSTTVTQLHANGVVSRVLLDVGFLVADGELVEITSLPLPSC
jgi:hypothetical protein